MRWPLLSVFVILAACSSSSSASPDSAAAEGARPPGDAGSCTGTCCALPEPGTSCDADAAETCAWAVTCATGLVISREVTCTSGKWASTSDCPDEGKNDARGCPARQPENGADCEPITNGAPCGYVLECPAYRKSATAVCSGRKWQTTPLGACD